MKLIDLTVKDFIDEVDSNSSAPGGGSVSALVSTLGISLSKMVSHLTFNKKKYLALDENIRLEYEANFQKLSNLKNELEQLIDKDTEAFNLFMEALKLPKETESEKQIRSEKLEEATLEAIKVPYEIVKLSLKGLEIIDRMVIYGNKNALSDIGVGCLLLYSGLEGGILNIKINLSGLSDEKQINFYKEEIINYHKKGIEYKEKILSYVNEELK